MSAEPRLDTFVLEGDDGRYQFIHPVDDPAQAIEYAAFALGIVLAVENGLDEGQEQMIREAAKRLDQVSDERR